MRNVLWNIGIHRMNGSFLIQIKYAKCRSIFINKEPVRQKEVHIMTKVELATAISEKAQISKKDAENVVRAFTDVIGDELKKGEKVQLVGFGTFETVKRAAREGRNPQTGAVVKIKASRSPKFKAGKALKDFVKG